MIARASTSLARKPGRAFLLSGAHDARARKGDPQPRARRGREPGPGQLAWTRRRVPERRGDRVPRKGSSSARLRRCTAPQDTVQRDDHRRTAASRSGRCRSTPIKAIKTSLGATVNDVVMAVCAGGLRTWLERHDALPDGPLVAMIPVSIRTGEETEKWTNRVSAIFASLPTDEADPVERVARVHDAMADAKRALRCRARRRADRLRAVPAARGVRPGDAHGDAAQRTVRHCR